MTYWRPSGLAVPVTPKAKAGRLQAAPSPNVYAGYSHRCCFAPCSGRSCCLRYCIASGYVVDTIDESVPLCNIKGLSVSRRSQKALHCTMWHCTTWLVDCCYGSKWVVVLAELETFCMLCTHNRGLVSQCTAHHSSLRSCVFCVTAQLLACVLVKLCLVCAHATSPAWKA